MGDRHPDFDRCTNLVGELLGPRGLLAQAWTAPVDQLTQRQQTDNEGGGGGKPGSRPPGRLDLWSHVQTTLDEAHTLAADELGAFVNSSWESCLTILERIPDLLEQRTAGDCRTCYRCNCHRLDHRSRDGICIDCPPMLVLLDPAQIQQPCTCRHRTVTRRVGQLHSTLRTALGLQEPRHDLVDGQCPACGSGKVSVRGERVWCRADDCDFVREGRSFGIGVLSAAG